ncbi:heparan sulfate glucosamine 3-O-sulfotransferase 1-like [Clavelina lepadiformis]|uniref:heparan sulfate glucosamine 3-O-sulfotransferase 1-like n=1 Tax=Clavelina lepadiformis TaxID=159417 RepID=UPI00404189F0
MSTPYKYGLSILIFFVALALFSSYRIHQGLSVKEYRRFQIIPDAAATKNFEDSSASSLQHNTTWRAKMWEELIKSCQNKTKTRRLPKIIGIGVEKCGTHALMQFLIPHPLIRIARRIECHFFDAKPGGSVEDYLKLMPEVEEDIFIMEKTPAYFNFRSPSIPADMKKIVPDAKLLLVLCDPVERVLSDFYQQWIMFNKTNQSQREFGYKTVDEYLDVYLPRVQKTIGDFDEENRLLQEEKIFKLFREDHLSHILTTGFYALHLQRWFKHFNETNLMIIDSGAMIKHPGAVIESAQRFLHLPMVLLKEDYVLDEESGYFCYKDWRNENKLKCLPSDKQRTRNGQKSLSPDAANTLQKFFESHNKALFKMLNRTFWT